jgi:dihydroorotate dehydrogenase
MEDEGGDDMGDGMNDNIIELVKETGMDGLVAVNTTTSREGLHTNPSLVAEFGNGGLSGSPLTTRALEVVRYINQKTDGHLPIMGVGGILTVQDALNMLDAGASLIQIYSGMIYNGPGFAKSICEAILKRKSSN